MMITGIFFALGAGLLWGLIFVSPMLVPDYPGALQSAGRYIAFGIIAMPLAWYDRHRLKRLQRQDWAEAVKLSLVGNLIYYTCLSSAIQRTGAPISTIIIGTLPVVLAVSANVTYGRDEGTLPWGRLSPALLLIATGLVCVNAAELSQSAQLFHLWRYLSGIAMALIAVVCWTWYPLRNARWLRHNQCHKPTTWATAQGVATLPLAVAAYGIICLVLGFTNPTFSLPFGPRPLVFVPLMIAIGLLCSWFGAFCWNEASQRLPIVLVGPLIVFETLAGLSYTFLLRQAWPPMLSLTGIACLIIGVAYAVSIKPQSVKKSFRSKR